MNPSVYQSGYHRAEVKADIPTCRIMGVDIAEVNMEALVAFLKENSRALSGDYICVSNVYTTVTAYEDPEYLRVQNGGVLAIPDGGPIAYVGRKRGFHRMQRTAGPDLMTEVFKISAANGYRHFFYGTTEETLQLLRETLSRNYPGIRIAGMYSPPFEQMTRAEDEAAVCRINEANPDFVWVGLGAPKQERWMAAHQGRVKGLMIGVGAGFHFHAGNLRRAPKWMREHSLEWLYRLMQDPVRLFGRYWSTNWKYIWHAVIRGK